MKFSIDGKELFALNDVQKNVIKDYLNSDIFEEDMSRRVFWVINEIYKESFKKLKSEWEPKLAAKGIKSIPTDKDEFAQLVFSQPEYKDRKARDLEDSK